MVKSALISVGVRIRDIRKQKGISQEQLGELAGVHYSYIGAIERGQKNITLGNLEKIASALNVSVNELFVYGKYSSLGKTEKDIVISQITERLSEMKLTELKKVQLFLNEFFDKK